MVARTPAPPLTVAQPNDAPQTGDRRAYLIDRLFGLWWVVIVDGLDATRARAIQNELLAELDQIDAAMLPDAAVTRCSRSAPTRRTGIAGRRRQLDPVLEDR